MSAQPNAQTKPIKAIDSGLTRLPVVFDVNFDPACTHGNLQRRVVGFRLIGIGDGEVTHRFIERVAGIHIALALF